MNDNIEVLETLYPEIRAQFDKYVYEQGISPMAVFGIYLGIMAQEFKEHASKDEFDVFLTKMMEVTWEQKILN